MIPGFGYKFAPEAINSKYRKEYVESTLMGGNEKEVVQWINRPLSYGSWQQRLRTPEIIEEVTQIYNTWKKNNTLEEENRISDLLQKIQSAGVSFVSKKNGYAFSISYISPDEETYFINAQGKEGYEININVKYPKLAKILQKLNKFEALGRDADLDMMVVVLSKEDCLSFVQSFKEEKWIMKEACQEFEKIENFEEEDKEL